MISIFAAYASEEISHKKLIFSGGEVQIKLELPAGHDIHSRAKEAGISAFAMFGSDAESYRIEADITSSEEVMELLMVTNAMRENFGHGIELDLVIPYLPYARQDRVCAPGEALALRVMCDIINSQKYSTVTVWDVHSDAAMIGLNRATNIQSADLLEQYIDDASNLIFVSPDAGAIKKVSAAAKKFGAPMIRADKTRDVNTGAITGTVVYSENVGSKDFLIVDDICDGGRTFIELAKVLQPLTTGKVMLYVTHGIFSQGLKVFDGLIDQIYCPNVFPKVEKTSILGHFQGEALDALDDELDQLGE